MKLTLDNQPIEVTEDNDASLHDVVERLSIIVQQQKRVISEIFVDGKQMGNWDDPEFVKLTVGHASELRVISEEPRKLAIRVLYDIAKFMPNIKQALIDTSEKIQSRKEQEGMALLEQITSTWAELLHGFQSAVLVTGIDLESVRVKDQTFLEINTEVHQYLEQVSAMVEEQRLLELSDILEYELAVRIPKLEEGIYQAIRYAEQKFH
jgi:hypothetical protein